MLRELIEHGPSITVTALAELISGELPDTDPRRVFAQLHHSHLPKLVDSGIVSVEDDVITLEECVEVVEPYLLLAERYESMRKE